MGLPDAQADVAILDEIDSGLDIDALREVSQAVNGLKSQANATVLVTHYKVPGPPHPAALLWRPPADGTRCRGC